MNKLIEALGEEIDDPEEGMLYATRCFILDSEERLH
jgi:hypothetical protein